jgi:hypothetical protein
VHCSACIMIMKLGGQVEVGDLEYTTYIRSRFACEYRGKHSYHYSLLTDRFVLLQ